MPSYRNDAGNGEQIGTPSLWSWFRLIVLLISAIGFFNIYSSTFYMNLENGVNPYNHVFWHGVYFIAGLVVCYGAYKMPLALFRARVCIWIYVLLTFLILVSVFFFGRTVNGATRWIYIGFSIQPSEIAKVTAILWAAASLADRLKRGEPVSFFLAFWEWLSSRFNGEIKGMAKKSFRSMLGVYTPLLVPLLFAGLVMGQPDMGTAALILGFPVLLYMFCGVPVLEIIVMLIISVFLFFGFAMSASYRWERVWVLWDPFSHATDQGYQTVQSLIAVGSGGIFGQGAGQGLAKFLYLPEQHTDFAFAVLSQEGGFLVASIVILLYSGLLAVGFLMAKRITRLFPALLVYGLTMLIGMEGFLNIAMVLGSFPVTGVPLPFISFGGSSLVMNLLSVGLIGNAVHYGEAMRSKEERAKKLEILAPYPQSLRKISGAVFRPPEDDRFKNY